MSAAGGAANPVRVHVAFGGNQGAVEANLRAALEALGELPQTRVVRVSSLYRTAPVGVLDQPSFLNGVVAVDTGLAPEPLLDALLALEQALGRVRSVRWGPRTVDLDILLWGSRVVDSARLQIPHPRLCERGFVLVPLAEIAAAAVHPLTGRTVAEHLGDLGCTDDVVRQGRPAWLRQLERGTGAP